MILSATTLLAVAACVRTIDELEVLLLLARHGERYCSAAMVGGETGLTASAAAGALETLASRNLLDVRVTDAVRYRLDPATSTARTMVERTLEAARRDRAAVWRAIRRRNVPTGERS